jgi:hypothetical protein
MIQKKIKAFRAQGFCVEMTQGPNPQVRVYDKSSVHIALKGAEAQRFILFSVILARSNCLRLEDAQRLHSFHLLKSHLQLTLPLDTG